MARNPYYQSGELIGRQGVEMQYEEYLRGKKGVKYLQKDRFNRQIGRYKDGLYDTLPVPGKDVHLTIDEDLQAYGELLMQKKHWMNCCYRTQDRRDPWLVSAPTYDPNLLVGRKRSKNYTALYRFNSKTFV